MISCSSNLLHFQLDRLTRLYYTNYSNIVLCFRSANKNGALLDKIDHSEDVSDCQQNDMMSTIAPTIFINEATSERYNKQYNLPDSSSVPGRPASLEHAENISPKQTNLMSITIPVIERLLPVGSNTRSTGKLRYLHNASSDTKVQKNISSRK